jgi:hypothetical protein
MCVTPRLHKLRPIIFVFSRSLPLATSDSFLRNFSFCPQHLGADKESSSSTDRRKQSWGFRTFASQTGTDEQWGITASVLQVGSHLIM